MSGLRTTVVLLASAALVALSFGSGDTATVVAGVLAVTVVALTTIRLAAAVIGAREVTVGARARSHRESVVGLVEPTHPGTPGRPRTRAPSESPVAV